MPATAPKKSASSRDPKVTADRQFVTALGRGLAVLRCFDATRTLLGTTEIAQKTNLPQPTVWRLCYTLQQLGYLMQAPDSDKLRIGMAVLGLGQYALGSTDIGEMVRMVKSVRDIPCAVGFGISTPQQAASMARLCDGVIVGSAIVRMVEQHGRACLEPVADYVRHAYLPAAGGLSCDMNVR